MGWLQGGGNRRQLLAGISVSQEAERGWDMGWAVIPKVHLTATHFFCVPASEGSPPS